MSEGAEDADGDRLASGDVAVQTGWRFRVGGAVYAPKIETLASGLAVYRLPAKALRAQLENGKAVLARAPGSSCDSRRLQVTPVIPGTGRRFARGPDGPARWVR